MKKDHEQLLTILSPEEQKVLNNFMLESNDENSVQGTQMRNLLAKASQELGDELSKMSDEIGGLKRKIDAGPLGRSSQVSLLERHGAFARTIDAKATASKPVSAPVSYPRESSAS